MNHLSTPTREEASLSKNLGLLLVQGAQMRMAAVPDKLYKKKVHRLVDRKLGTLLRDEKTLILCLNPRKLLLLKSRNEG